MTRADAAAPARTSRRIRLPAGTPAQPTSIGLGYLGAGSAVVCAIALGYGLVRFALEYRTLPAPGLAATAWILLVALLVASVVAVRALRDRMPGPLMAVFVAGMGAVVALDLVAVWPLGDVMQHSTAGVAAGAALLTTVTYRPAREVLTVDAALGAVLLLVFLVSDPVRPGDLAPEISAIARAVVPAAFGVAVVRGFRRVVEMEARPRARAEHRVRAALRGRHARLGGARAPRPRRRAAARGRGDGRRAAAPVSAGRIDRRLARHRAAAPPHRGAARDVAAPRDHGVGVPRTRRDAQRPERARGPPRPPPARRPPLRGLAPAHLDGAAQRRARRLGAARARPLRGRPAGEQPVPLRRAIVPIAITTTGLPGPASIPRRGMLSTRSARTRTPPAVRASSSRSTASWTTPPTGEGPHKDRRARVS
ncbi:hypothetical protein [Clavibacter tessellarius]|uniref:hypothetical protein n=1 Tax=Clavibacter tessellarius TaxID=31965 RepID=UPI0032457941